MLRHVPYCVLCFVIVLAVLLSPVVSLALLFLAFELLWALVDAFGLPTLFALACLAAAAGILLHRLLPRRLHAPEAG